jgi:hypothetical protein
MDGKQAELRGRQRFRPKLRVDAAGFNFLRCKQPFETIAQYFAPVRERGRDQHAQYALSADLEAGQRRWP